jgi:hypothetical protein
MKAHEKKKRFKALCRAQVKKGLINLASGQWGPGVDNSMKRDMKGGYHVG